jgi:hypothetical protein
VKGLAVTDIDTNIDPFWLRLLAWVFALGLGLSLGRCFAFGLFVLKFIFIIDIDVPEVGSTTSVGRLFLLGLCRGLGGCGRGRRRGITVLDFSVEVDEVRRGVKEFEEKTSTEGCGSRISTPRGFVTKDGGMSHRDSADEKKRSVTDGADGDQTFLEIVDKGQGGDPCCQTWPWSPVATISHHRDGTTIRKESVAEAVTKRITFSAVGSRKDRIG